MGHSKSSEMARFDRLYNDFPISSSISSDNVSVWHHFRDITTFTVFEIVCDLGKSFNSDTTDGRAMYAIQFISQ